MTQSKCPACGCEQFYVKDPDDAYDTFEFECRDGQACFAGDLDSDACPAVSDDTEVYCNACAWHDRFFTIKQ